MRRYCAYFVILSLIMSLLLSGCGSDAPKSEAPKSEPQKSQAAPSAPAGSRIEGGKVVMIVEQNPDFLDPHLMKASGTEEMLLNVYEGLMKPDEKGNAVPGLAESFKISPDGLTYTFTLRPGVKFHNDKPVTVEDVKYSYERIMGKDTGKPLNTTFAKVKSVDTPDDKTIVLTLKDIDAGLLANLSTSMIIPKGVDTNKTPVGTGPFKLEQYVPEQKVVLKKFASYWQKGVPALDEVEFRIVPDREAALIAFKAGEIDMYPRLVNERVVELGDKFKYVQGLQNMVQLMAMNNSVKPFDDIRVRKAINYAVDIDQIIKGVASGYGTKLGSNMSPVMAKYFQDGLQDTYKTNIEKAKALLKEAGYEKGFKTTLSVPSNYQFHVDTAEMIVQQLSKVGIEVKIELVEWGVWLERIYNGRKYDMTVIAFTGKLDPSKVLGRYASNYAQNFFNYKNPKVDEMLVKAEKEIDDAKRVQYYKDVQKILTEDVPAVFIMDPQMTVAMKKNIAGYKNYPLYYQDMSCIYLTK